MPKLPKGFGRRKSTANALEELENAPVAAPSFRVFERPKEGNRSFDGGMTFARTQTAPAPPRKNTPTKRKEENMFEELKVNRGSGASNTNTASTTDNSSRLSAASTAPSSTSHRSNDEYRSPHDKPYADIPLPPIPKSQSAFSLKAAGRTFSFGLGKSTLSPSHTIDENRSPTTPEDSHLSRPRAVTGSSYASTATPPKLDDQNLGLSLGGDFSDMFSGFTKRKSVIMDAEVGRAMSSSPDLLQAGPTVPSRSYAPTRSNHPTPLNIDRTKEVEASPHSWNSQHSNDGLIGNSSPLYPPPVPRHGNLQASNPAHTGSPSTRASKLAAPVDRFRKGSALAVRQQSTSDRDEVEDEDAKFLKESASVIRRLTEDTPARARDSWLNPTTTPSTGSSLNDKQSGTSGWRRGTPETTRKPPTIGNINTEDNMFAQVSSSSIVNQRNTVGSSTSKQQNNGSTNKVMTLAQFERNRQDQERRNSSITQLRDEDNDEDAYEEDDEDETEKQKQIAKQRRKQEAHMAVYRQQMMKVTGEAPSPVQAARSGMSFSQSSPNLARLGSTTPEDEEEDEEVPLAILAAHGFPNKTRHPIQLSSMNSNPNLRASTQMGAYPHPSAAGAPIGGGSLPVFARNLPQDPYFGAGLVNPTNRESLAFGSGAASLHGGAPGGLPPGGLVGVIATEERSRAMRRGSPNAGGGYAPPPPSNGFNGMGMPNMPRSATMGNLNGMPPMGQMPMFTPGDQAQIEMQQQMQQFMQMQMQFMQMMTVGGQGNQGRPQSQNGLPPPQGLRPMSSHQRAMSMMDPNAAPWQQQNMQRNTMFAPSIHLPGNQYAPSIAPSERSNVGLPGRYRPVSQYPTGDSKSRTASMSGALQDWSDGKHSSVTLKVVKKSGNVSDEDDEEGWAAMKQKREKNKSKWRSKKGDSGLKDLMGYTA